MFSSERSSELDGRYPNTVLFNNNTHMELALIYQFQDVWQLAEIMYVMAQETVTMAV